MNKLGFGFLRLPVKKGSPDDIDLDLLDHIKPACGSCPSVQGSFA